jgi:hypothetical protein
LEVGVFEFAKLPRRGGIPSVGFSRVIFPPGTNKQIADYFPGKKHTQLDIAPPPPSPPSHPIMQGADCSQTHLLIYYFMAAALIDRLLFRISFPFGEEIRRHWGDTYVLYLVIFTISAMAARKSKKKHSTRRPMLSNNRKLLVS